MEHLIVNPSNGNLLLINSIDLLIISNNIDVDEFYDFVLHLTKEFKLDISVRKEIEVGNE